MRARALIARVSVGIALVAPVFLILIALMLRYGPGQTISELGDAAASVVGLRACYRSPVSCVKADMRTVATALESYYIDHNRYPSMTPLVSWPLESVFVGKSGADRMTSMVTGRGAMLHGLTTPISYISGFPLDPFSNWPRARLYDYGRWFTHSYDYGVAPFAYWGDDLGWILISPGPDLDYDVDPGVDYDPKILQPSLHLLTKAYDGTNGTSSNGDIFRVKQ